MFTRNGRHVTAEGRSRWRRKIAGVPVVGWIIGASGTALAIVGFLVFVGASGSVTSAAGIDVYAFAGSGSSTVLAGSPTCSTSVVGDGEVALTFADAYPGDSCSFTVSFANKSQDAAARLQDFALSSVDFAGGDIEADLGAACGTTINAAASQDLPAGVLKAVTVTLTASASLTPGQTFTFDPLNDGWEWVVDSLYDAGAGCNL